MSDDDKPNKQSRLFRRMERALRIARGEKVDRPKPPGCPECGSVNTKWIAYGNLDDDPTPVEEWDYVRGGCNVFDDSPNCYCADCTHMFSHLPPPDED